MAAAEYRKLIIIVWLILAAAMGTIQGPNAWSGASWDSDDFLRLVQVRDLLAGQAWSDLTQYRMNPPHGTLMQWARLPDVPIVLVTLALSPLLGQDHAMIVAAVVLPPIYFLMFLGFFAYASRLLLGRANSPISLLVAIGGSFAIRQFIPGRVDHQGLQLVLMMAAVMLLLYGLARERWGRAITWTGVPFALSIWIGAETLPFIASWFAALGLAWCYLGGKIARHGAGAALLGTAIGLLIMLTSQPEALWLSTVCDAFSMMPIAMLALTGAGFGGMALLDSRARSPSIRLSIAAACGLAAFGVFAFAFPACLGGGYEALDPVVKDRWLSNVVEAISWVREFELVPFRAIMDIWTPALGLGYCIWRMRRAERRGRVLWGVIAVLVLASGAVVFWQVRAVSFAQSVALLPLSALVADALRYIWRRPRRWVRYAAAPLLLYVCSFVFWPSVQGVYGIFATKLPSTLARQEIVTLSCSSTDTFAPLQDSPPNLVLSYLDLGAVILFRTPHSIVASHYHRDNEGLRTTIDLFSSNDDAWIKAQVKERGIGWVVTCPGPEENTVFRTENRDGLAERLAAGQVPGYLEQIAGPAASGMRFYRVRTAN